MSKPRTLPAELSTSRTTIPATKRFDPISVRIDDAGEIIGVSRDKMWRLVRDKRVASFKIDGCTLVLWEDLRQFVYLSAGRPIELDPGAD
ncbi:hypothetical protein P7D22_04665 [Lichenihabitans sp. Uapishka_5]|uniref:hypothetical protein n=1 Tax=Lichenihabitans sp. Uapishka_5 TaxID=3037302 RepID=UPI0029E813CE|nr:hypothetical protein [Lichenihabitans sp. Uapishka_5]MDX7950471.1 hypothetical protein [Lichenihabitans sp. Uapishka_5]